MPKSPKKGDTTEGSIQFGSTVLKMDEFVGAACRVDRNLIVAVDLTALVIQVNSFNFVIPWSEVLRRLAK